MGYAITVAVAIAVVLLLAALLVVWSRRDIPLIRALVIPAALLAAAGATMAIGSTLGFAVPLIGGITAPPGDAQMLSAKLVPGQGIYVTIDLPDEPRLFWMPWDREMAEAIQGMFMNPDTAGVIITVPPFEWSWDKSPPSFQALPQPKVLPDKPPQPKQAPHFSA